jgi:hypothetical protein
MNALTQSNNKLARASQLLAAVALASALAACGGGGGDSTSTSSSTSTSGSGSGSTSSSGSTTTDVVSSAGNLQTTAIASTYGAGSDGDAYYTTLNTVRLSAGAGVLNQNAALDTASAAHALYEVANYATEGYSHTEVATSTDFYGVTFTDRDTTAGYTSALGTEVQASSFTGSQFAFYLLSTAYHGAALLSDSTDVGYGASVYPSSAGGGYFTVSDLGAPSTYPYGQVAASGSFIAYPYSGQTGVEGTFSVNAESPRVSTTLFPAATAGAPVIVNIRNADYVNFNAQGTLAPVVTSFTLKDASGTVVPAVIIANSAITGGTGVTVNSDTELGAGVVELIATSPLTSGVTYTVTFTATLKTGGTPLTSTWTFLVS